MSDIGPQQTRTILQSISDRAHQDPAYLAQIQADPAALRAAGVPQESIDDLADRAKTGAGDVAGYMRCSDIFSTGCPTLFTTCSAQNPFTCIG